MERLIKYSACFKYSAVENKHIGTFDENLLRN